MVDSEIEIRGDEMKEYDIKVSKWVLRALSEWWGIANSHNELEYTVARECGAVTGTVQHLCYDTVTFVHVKVKCTLVQALRLCTGRTAHRGSRGIALPFHDHGTRRGWGVSVTPRPFFTPRKDPVPIIREAGWAPGPVWTGAENLAPTGIRSPDGPAP